MINLTQHAAQLLLLLFLIITFAQSAFDKLRDWKGNLTWLNGHFSQTPLSGLVSLLLSVLAAVELIAALLCTAGFFQILAFGKTQLAFYGAISACIALLMLLFGQRLAKDYAGAMTIAVYFVSAVFLVFLLQ